ncbi:ABC transporter substrate-binding protein [Synergistales bacterium]|nr:ABC transporter substrate-binding protein [Synergistales bacterium]
MRRSQWCTLLLLAVILQFSWIWHGADVAEGASGNIRVRLSVTGADTAPISLGAKKWAELVEQKSNGRIVIQVFPNEQLSSGNQQKGLENLQMGVIQASMHSSIIYSVLDPRFSVPSLPWLIPNFEAVDKAFAGKGGEILKEIARTKGIEPIAFMENGFRQITNGVRPIHTPDDMKNMKLRVPSMKLYMDLFASLGADPISMNIGEVFTSLQQKTIDGQENPISVIHSRKFYEVQKYLTLCNYSYDPYIVGVNKKFWDNLDDGDKEILLSTMKEAAVYQLQLTRDTEQKQIEEITQAGTVVDALTPEETAVFQERVQGIYDQYGPQFGKEFIDAFKNP